MPISATPAVTTLTVNIPTEEEPLLNIMSALFCVLDHDEFDVLPDEAKLRCIDYVRDIASLRVSLPKTKTNGWVIK